MHAAQPSGRDGDIFPVELLPVGDDGKRKPFHVIRCLHRLPRCTTAPLRLAIGNVRFPNEAIVKFALQRGWYCDKRGYALCALHKPGAQPRKRPELTPEQRRAAFIRIREKELAAARVVRLPAPATAAADRAPRHQKAKKIMAVLRASPAAMHCKQIAALVEHDETKTRWIVRNLVRRGLIRRVKPGWFATKEEIIMPSGPIAAETPAPLLKAVDEPRQPTRDQNRLIRDFLDAHYDEQQQRWREDWSDEKAAKKLNIPRAWIARIRDEFCGPDVSEAGQQHSEAVIELLQTATKLKDDALAMATRAEDIERAARKHLGIDRP